jgi:hypothetical protein
MLDALERTAAHQANVLDDIIIVSKSCALIKSSADVPHKYTGLYFEKFSRYGWFGESVAINTVFALTISMASS